MNKKVIMILLIAITLLNSIAPSLNAAEIEKANLINDHAIDTHIMYKPNGEWTKIKGAYICYIKDGEKYPAYCISHGIHGVDEEGDYAVTINDLLKDKLIYNTILNGYPYKTPEQLGVATKDDAYIATKQAIYSVLLERDVKEFYKAADSQGENIIDAIYNISEKGKAGNSINQDANLKIKKVSDIKEEEKYYYQEYSVAANVNIKDYTVENIEGFSKDTYISDINGKKKDTFQSSEKFRVMMPKKDFTKDISGKINIKATCKTNPVFFGEAPNSSVQNYAVTYKPYAKYSASTILDIKANTAKIKVVKKDKETLKPIKGVEFSLYNSENELIDKKVTNDAGEVSFLSLYQGKYYIKELKTTDDYIKDETRYEVDVEYNETVTKEMLNEHKKGNLKVIKIDKDNKNNTLGGIEFDLINSNGEVVKHFVTDADGECYIENIDIGDYILKETKTKKEYRTSRDMNVTIKWNETLEIIAENEKKKGKLEIYKVDSEDNNIKIKDVEFELLDTDNKVVQKLKTNEKGYAVSGNLEIGKYYLKEVKTDSKYVLDDKKIAVDIQDNKTTTFTLENKKIKGNIKIIKTSSNNSELLNLRKGERISKVKFEIYDSNKNLVETLITDENGEAVSKDLEVGRYIVKEAGRKQGFLLNNKEYVVNISQNNKTEVINVENIPIVPRVKIEKTGVKYAEKNEEIKYEFNIKNNSNIDLDELTWVDYLPFENAKLTKIMTGIYNEDVNYCIYYKTDKSDYKLLKEVNSLNNEYIDIDKLNLIKNEKIIELKIEFGKVSEKFVSVESPNIFVKVNNNVKKDSKIINKTELIGIKDGYKTQDKDLFETIIKEKEIIKKLPKTGC